jgi:hypothetical protein
MAAEGGRIRLTGGAYSRKGAQRVWGGTRTGKGGHDRVRGGGAHGCGGRRVQLPGAVHGWKRGRTRQGRGVRTGYEKGAHG